MLWNVMICATCENQFFAGWGEFYGGNRTLDLDLIRDLVRQSEQYKVNDVQRQQARKAGMSRRYYLNDYSAEPMEFDTFEASAPVIGSVPEDGGLQLRYVLFDHTIHRFMNIKIPTIQAVFKYNTFYNRTNITG